jgi:RNA polymerase sigma-70 factor, ECF subfamily
MVDDIAREEIFQQHRGALFGIAYRMLGSAAEAEDVVQDAYLRYAASAAGAPEEVRSPRAYLRTVVTRLCLDRLKAARTTRELYIGPWLPEPVLTMDDTEVTEAAEMHESITMAFLVLLERLTPQERAVFLLHDVFDYEHAEIAEMLRISVANSRQTLRRAKSRIAEGKPRFRPSPRQQREIVKRFAQAVQNGDLKGLTSMLAEEVAFTADGGGKVAAITRPLLGVETVMKMLRSISRTAQQLERENPGSTQATIASVNGEPAMLAWIGDRLETVFMFHFDGDKIGSIWAIRNPDKLAYLLNQLSNRANN